MTKQCWQIAEAAREYVAAKKAWTLGAVSVYNDAAMKALRERVSRARKQLFESVESERERS